MQSASVSIQFDRQYFRTKIQRRDHREGRGDLGLLLQSLIHYSIFYIIVEISPQIVTIRKRIHISFFPKTSYCTDTQAPEDTHLEYMLHTLQTRQVYFYRMPQSPLFLHTFRQYKKCFRNDRHKYLGVRHNLRNGFIWMLKNTMTQHILGPRRH